jgi:uncharacterized protein (TIGR03000 family)
MYSVILMAAMTTGTAEAPSFGFCHHWCGCSWGYRPISCCGFYPASYGCSCYGACHGCWGSCYGYGCSCHGACHGCWGSCYGCACYGACYGGGACYGTYMYPAYSLPANYAVPAGTMPMMPASPGGAEKAPLPKTGGQGDLSARVIVDVPADAKVFIDDQQMKSTSSRRQFATPRLEKGQSYYYIVRAEIVRDGETLTDTRRVILKAGDVVQASFRDETAFKATPKGTITVTAARSLDYIPMAK